MRDTIRLVVDTSIVIVKLPRQVPAFRHSRAEEVANMPHPGYGCLRLMGYYSEIRSPSSGTDVFKHTKGIILSGGPSSVYEKNIPCGYNVEFLIAELSYEQNRIKEYQ